MYKTTVVSISVHSETDNAIYGETAVKVSLEDDSCGWFIVLESYVEDLKPGEIRLDLEQLELITAEARRLINQHDDVTIVEVTG